MIEATFDRYGRQAAVCGVYQYDTGQRMAMHGLPSPHEFLAMDELLSGETVTVLAQFSYEGDSQTEPRLAEWDERRAAWMVQVPDEYLTRSRTVRVLVEVYYGAGESGERTKTCYEGVFRPIGRPASNDTATDDQLAAWAALEAEIDLALASANETVASAQSRVQNAQTAAAAAEAAAERAQQAAQEAGEAQRALADAAQAISGWDIAAVQAAPGSAAEAALSGHALTLRMPRGADGARGEKGDTGDKGPADIALSFSGGVLTITPR